jgi:hypothetical protein
MRTVLIAGLLAATTALAATPSQAQGGAFMWCQARADNGAQTSVYYSAFFSAGAHQAEVKARAFKSEVQDEEVSASTVTAKCMTPGSYDEVVAARNAAMKAEPGKVLSWEG